MKNLEIRNIFYTYLVACFGAFLFYSVSLPIPWILGPLSAILIHKGMTKKTLLLPTSLNNMSLMFIGIYFGLSFTKMTLFTVSPYILPFIFSTILLLTISVINSIAITKFIKIDPITSVFGSIPGGLPEMVAASESLSANSGMVTIFQTVRLLTVVFTVPFLVVHMFTSSEQGIIAYTPSNDGFSYQYLWFGLAIIAGWLIRNIIPAAYVIGPLLVTALLNISGVSLPTLPNWLLIVAQITVGISMGNKISINELKFGGKYCGLYFLMTILLIGTSFGIGYIFASLTNLSLSTAILSLSPGGMVEMVFTAKSVGADAAVVSSLQLIRLLFIILVVPSFLKFLFNRRSRKINTITNQI